MKYTLTLLTFYFVYSLAIGQSIEVLHKTEDASWVQFEPTAVESPIEQIAHEVLELSPSSDLRMIRQQSDELGMTHIRMQQYVNDVPVYAQQYIMHMDGNKLLSSNGTAARSFDPSSARELSTEQALQIGLKQRPSRLLARDHKEFKEIAPEALLYWYPTHAGEDGSMVYRLVYVVSVYSLMPHYKFDYFVDASTGEILHEIDMLHTTGVPHQCETIHNGIRTIEVTERAPDEFILLDEGRNVSTTSVDINFSNEVELVNDTTFWSTDDYQFGELDAHWGAMLFHDYLDETFSRNSIDDQGFPMECKVVREPGYSNAFWNGRFTTYGAGDGVSTLPFTILDVVGHEFTHGMVQFTSGLIYQGESGALNESFADIFGKTLEWYATPDEFTWIVGDGIYPTRARTGIRSMSDPNEYGDPNYVGGEFWADTNADFDNGGVHINSGVQNFWFYLLTEGQAGTNERGVSYNVEAIGIEKAEQIAYRNMAFYLTPSSNYISAFQGSIQSVIDLYGECSPEHVAVVEAWYAVGATRNNLRRNNYEIRGITGVETACGLGDEKISAIIGNTSCVAFDNPDEITMYFQVDGGDVLSATYNVDALNVISEDLEVPLDDFIDLKGVGDHTIKVWTEAFDVNQRDDTLEIEIENLLVQNGDFLAFSAPDIPGDCDISTAKITGVFEFMGCDSIEAGEEVALSYLFNEDESTRVTETYAIPNTLYRGDLFEYEFQTLGDFSEEGEYELFLDVTFADDPFMDNNMAEVNTVYHTQTITEEQSFRFVRRNQIDLDYSYLNVGEESEWGTTGGTRALQLSGGEAFDLSTNMFTIPYPNNEDEMWNTNTEYNSEYCMCVDASNWSAGEVSFSRAVTRNGSYTFFLPEELAQYGSAMRVTVNGEAFSDTYFGEPRFGRAFSEMFVNDTLDLTSLAGTSFDLCFQSHHFLRDGDLYGDDPDATYLDNITVRGMIAVANDEEIALSNQLNIFPNPVSEQLQIALPQSIVVSSYRIRSVTGQLIQAGQQEMMNRADLQVGNLVNGSYILELETTDQKLLRKQFVKVN